MNTYPWLYDLRCCVCGQFVKFNSDSSVDFGRDYVLEQPDPKWYCAKCAEEEYKKALSYKGSSASSFWHPPKWAVRADAAKREDEK